MRTLFIKLCLLLLSGVAHAQYFDTVSIHYALGSPVIDKRSQLILDSLAVHTTGQQKLLIYSYADYLGTEKPNLHLSEERAAQVKQYLLKKGVAETQILECTGLGQLPASPASGERGDHKSRRTDIFIRRNAVAGSGKGNPYIPPKQDIRDLSGMKANETIKLDNIGFYRGLDKIIPGSLAQLETLYGVLKEDPSLRIRIEGHVCCCTYPDGYDENSEGMILSVKRSVTVYKYLVNKGIDGKRLQYKGYGRTQPIYDVEATEEQKQANRRVEIRKL